MPNPFDAFDNQAGPVYGPPPKAPAPAGPPSGYRPEGEGLTIIPGGPADPYRPGGEYDPKKPPKDASDYKPTEFQSKSAGFLGRLARANSAWEALPTTERAPRGIAREYVHGNFPGLENTFINSGERQVADQNALDFVRASLRQESGASINADEEVKQYKIFFPMPGDGPEVLAQKALARKQAIEGFKVAAGPLAVDALASLQVDDQGAAPPGEQTDKSRNPAEIEAPSGDLIAQSTSGTQTVDNPALTGVRGKYLGLLEANASPQEIVGFLRQAGINDPKILASAAQQANYRKQNPNVPIANYNTSSLDDMDVPLSSTESMMNSAAQSAPGAYAMRAGNSFALNNLDSLVGATGGNAERARIGLEDAGNAHPAASLAGDITGGVGAALGGEAALGGFGMAPGFGRALIADTAYGAGSGAGAADDGNRLGGAVRGGLAGLAGSVAGQGLVKAGGSVISPTGGRLSDLYEAGVRPTPGQRFVNAGDGKGLAGLAGRALNATEEAVSSVPIVGSAIRGARQEARDQFQIGAYNEALKEVGQKLPKNMKVGTAPYAYTKEVFNKAYDKARSGMRLGADSELNDGVTKLADDVTTLAEPSIRRFDTIVKNTIMRRVKGDYIEGADYKAIQSEIGKVVRGIRKSPSGDGELADKLDELSGLLDQAARRHSDPEAVKLLDAADAGYAKFVRIRDAAKARGGGAGEFSPTQFDRSVQKNTGGQHSDAYLRGDALMQGYADQGMSLVDRVPNSGSADRAMVGLTAAGGAGMIEPSSLGLLGILGTLYAPGVRKLTKGVMAPRGEAAKAIADQVRKRARIAGAGGAALASQTSADR